MKTLKLFIKYILTKLNIKYEDWSYFKNRRIVREMKNYPRQIEVLQKIQKLYTDKYLHPRNFKHKIACVIFSFDRAFQMYSLLGGIQEKLTPKIPIYIFYRTSTEAHKKAYQEVFDHYKSVINLVEQKSKETFTEQITELIAGIDSEKIMFLVDDIVFTEDVNIEELTHYPSDRFIPTLRLGKNCVRCYTNNTDQKLPDFINSPELKKMEKGVSKNYWIFGEGDYDWNYMLSVDGTIFDREEYLLLMKNTEFKSPNTLEYEMMTNYQDLFKQRIGVCYDKSRIVNMPINKVQQEIFTINLHGEIHQDDLLKLWQDGYMMDYKKLYGYNSTGAHQEIKFDIVKRADYGKK